MDEAPIVAISDGLYTLRSISTHASAHMSRFTVAAFAALALLFSAASGFAADPTPDPDLPQVDQPGTWHIVTGRRELPNSDGHCVGGIKTPFCALATIFACFVNPAVPTEGPTFCTIVTGDPKGFEWYGINPVHYYVAPSMIMFHIASVSRLDADDHTGAISDTAHRPMAGDISIMVNSNQCIYDPIAQPISNEIFYCIPSQYKSYTFFIRRFGNHWRAVNYERGPSRY
jgi:hypothetical protein